MFTAPRIVSLVVILFIHIIGWWAGTVALIVQVVVSGVLSRGRRRFVHSDLSLIPRSPLHYYPLREDRPSGRGD